MANPAAQKALSLLAQLSAAVGIGGFIVNESIYK